MLDIKKYRRNWSICEHCNGQMLKKPYRLSCEDNCLIYLLTCKCKQYLEKPLVNSVLNGTIEKAVIGNCTEFSMYERTLMYKTDDKDPKMIKN